MWAVGSVLPCPSKEFSWLTFHLIRWRIPNVSRRREFPRSKHAVHAKTLGEVLARSVVFPDDMVRLEASLSQKFDIAQLKMTAEFEKLRSDMNVLKAMVGILISLTLPIFFKLYFA